MLQFRVQSDLSQPCRTGATTLRVAVGNAIAAYARTGKMVDAALAYAEADLPIFPVDPVSKAPIPPSRLLKI